MSDVNYTEDIIVLLYNTYFPVTGDPLLTEDAIKTRDTYLKNSQGERSPVRLENARKEALRILEGRMDRVGLKEITRHDSALEVVSGDPLKTRVFLYNSLPECSFPKGVDVESAKEYAVRELKKEFEVSRREDNNSYRRRTANLLALSVLVGHTETLQILEKAGYDTDGAIPDYMLEMKKSDSSVFIGEGVVDLLIHLVLRGASEKIELLDDIRESVDYLYSTMEEEIPVSSLYRFYSLYSLRTGTEIKEELKGWKIVIDSKKLSSLLGSRDDSRFKNVFSNNPVPSYSDLITPLTYPWGRVTKSASTTERLLGFSDEGIKEMYVRNYRMLRVIMFVIKSENFKEMVESLISQERLFSETEISK